MVLSNKTSLKSKKRVREKRISRTQDHVKNRCTRNVMF